MPRTAARTPPSRSSSPSAARGTTTGATGIALLGCGVIGSAVADALLQEAPLFKRRAGVSLQLRAVVERDMEKTRKAGVPDRLVTVDYDAVLKDPAIHVVIELFGGLEPARTFVLKALKAGKHVVTANKYLIAVHGKEIFAAAKRAGKCVMFEASTGGCIPIIAALSHSLLANDISRVVGIVNGTCNYILTQMTQHGQTYADALKGAQAAGYAEPDPTFDVNGTDSANKIAILASLAFDAEVPYDAMHVTGIDNLSDLDLKFAKEFGYVCKLLAIGEKIAPSSSLETRNSTPDTRLSLRVHPTFVSNQHLLANVHGPFNAILVDGHMTGQTVYYGRGAGGRPTTSAILSDVLEIALGTAPLLFERLPLLTKKKPAEVVPLAEVVSRNYLRVTALDVPGVMAATANVLAKHKISLAGITQHESKAGQPVPIVITTHEAKEGDIAKALAEINKLPQITAETIRIRVFA
jgi:homoserine dehydrogenase